MRWIVMIAALTAAVAGCATDPDAATRDQAAAEAREYAENLELPAGYEVLDIEHVGAQTPKENRGGGQSGYFTIYFEASSASGPADVLSDLNSWFTGDGMVPASWNGTNKCDEDEIAMVWAEQDGVVVAQYWTDGPKYLVVPYHYGGVVVRDSSAVDTDVTLPECPAG